MTMGQRIRLARMEAGLSQRQLAGDVMTRNMLSALEHDGANPSIATLRYLSEKLCKPMSYFLGEEIPMIPEAGEMETVRNDFQAGEYQKCLKQLQTLQSPVFEAERQLLESLCLLELAEKAAADGRMPYSTELLRRCEDAMARCLYMKEALNRRWLIVSARAAGEKDRAGLAAKIPADDEAMLLRAQGAVHNGEYDKARRLLEAMEVRSGAEWNYLRGELHLLQQEYAKAAQCYHRAELEKSEKTNEKLEICYREMGDYKMAYYYAKKGKNGN